MRKQTVRFAAAGIVGVLLAVALVGMVNWVAARHWVRSDWTSSRLYTLSEKTESILADLDQDVEVVVFMTPTSPLYDQVRELLRRYEAASGRIHVTTIDPDREPLKTRQMAEEFGISAANTVVFKVGDRTKYVTSDQMASYDYSGMQMGQPPTMQAFTGEERFTSAILSLVAPSVPKIYFVTGHGEASLEAASGPLADRGLSSLAEALKRENIEAEDTSLLSGSIPDDADLLAIIGPTHPYTEIEIDLLRGWLDGGGRLLVCLDPLIDPSGVMRQTRLEPLLAEHGVEVHDDLVVDPSRKLPFYDLSAVYLTDFPSHPVTTGLEGTAVLFMVARSLGSTDDPAWPATPVVETSADGWGETDLGKLLSGEPVDVDDADTAGPAVVGMAVEHADAADPAGGEPTDESEAAEAGDPAAGARLLVYGDSDFMADAEIVNAGNLALALNSFNWLAAREQSLGIPPRDVEQVSLFLSADQMRTILLVTLLVMPGAAIGAGVLVWRRRRH